MRRLRDFLVTRIETKEQAAARVALLVSSDVKAIFEKAWLQDAKKIKEDFESSFK